MRSIARTLNHFSRTLNQNFPGTKDNGYFVEVPGTSKWHAC
jgi:hypothetical protein